MAPPKVRWAMFVTAIFPLPVINVLTLATLPAMEAVELPPFTPVKAKFALDVAEEPINRSTVLLSG